MRKLYERLRNEIGLDTIIKLREDIILITLLGGNSPYYLHLVKHNNSGKYHVAAYKLTKYYFDNGKWNDAYDSANDALTKTVYQNVRRQRVHGTHIVDAYDYFVSTGEITDCT